MSQILSPLAHARALLILGLPLVGGHLAQFLIGLTDTIMVGWYGVPELAALTLAASLFMTLFLFGSGFAWAVMPLVASAAVTRDDVTIRRVTRMALWLSGLFFVCVMPLLWWSAPILRAIGQEPEVAANAQVYLRIAGWGMAPALGVMALKSYLAGLEHTRVVLWITVAAAVANGFGNYALIFGNWGAPELGIRGAAIASLLSHLTALAGVVLYARRKLPQHQLFVRFWRPDTEVMARVFRLGWPIGVTTLAEVALFAASAVMMGWIGTVSLAAHGIALQLASASFMIHLGLSNAATIRASNAAGRGDLTQLRRGAWVVSVLSLIVVALTTVLFLALPDQLIGLFIDPAEPRRAAILEVGRILLALAALFQLADAMQVIHVGVLRGLQDTRVPMVITTISYWAIGLTCSYTLAFFVGWGATGLWLGLTFGLTCAAIGLATRFWTSAARLLPATA
ncbi:MATE family efflux transporter [Mesobacterium pallidum]|uniref:MATE family efflux transporter n=1 Tax=Mesobacterium pallidum TaxID=2872037 RepID=UPI001EE355E3|nr:MATE family efflux transporter [Mesobacterium pallidum]